MKSVQENFISNTFDENVSLNELLKRQAERSADYYNSQQGTDNSYQCEKCKNKGFIEKVVEYEQSYTNVLVPCECYQIRKNIKHLNQSGLGKYTTKKFNDYVVNEEWQQVIKSKAINYCENNDNKWFTILGQSGCGKTLICSIISNYHILKKNKELIYLTWTDFISKIKRDVMANKSDEVSDYFRVIKEVEMLFIDELIKKYNETDLKYVIELINYRYNHDLVTIITSEKTIDELLNIDQATFGRVVEKSSEYLIVVPNDKSKNQRIKGKGIRNK